jgi:LmbE family N-acetylglucosaminyl deacetylase
MKADSVLEGKHVLMVLAHCDDELVCGWPIFQNPKIRKSLIIVSSDRNNLERQWCSHRKFVSQDLCRSLGIDSCILDHDSEFYRLDHRSGKLANLEQDILRSIRKFSFDYLFTHNPQGEYGHLDHVFISNLLLRAADYPLLISDLSMTSDWTKAPPASHRFARTYYRNPVGEFVLDHAFYRCVMQFYETRGVWTWSQLPEHKCNLFFL